MLNAFTDGGCHPNPGPGGWAYIIKDRDCLVDQGSGYEPATTNSRMELTAAVMALRAVPEGGSATLTSDSQYLVKGLNEWRHTWKKYGWRGVKNVDLWQELDELVGDREVRAEWIRGHDGHPENELCDRMASEAYRGRKVP